MKKLTLHLVLTISTMLTCTTRWHRHPMILASLQPLAKIFIKPRCNVCDARMAVPQIRKSPPTYSPKDLQRNVCTYHHICKHWYNGSWIDIMAQLQSTWWLHLSLLRRTYQVYPSWPLHHNFYCAKVPHSLCPIIQSLPTTSLYQIPLLAEFCATIFCPPKSAASNTEHRRSIPTSLHGIWESCSHPCVCTFWREKSISVDVLMHLYKSVYGSLMQSMPFYCYGGHKA